MSSRPGRTPRPDVIDAPFTIAVDTREQLPFGFAHIVSDAREGYRPVRVPCERRTLHSGDYSIVGHEVAVAVERKSHGDLVHTLGQERERFERELIRLNELAYATVVIEAEWSEILAGYERSQLDPKTIHRSIIAWQQRLTRVHWWMCSNRAMAEVTTYRILERWWRDRQRADGAEG